ncbi:hypothetical protein DICSQDRAFT_70886 [Dichomitus squalens LYAD-421 SS1]|uniref:Uncharacterized protein n=1 Tax=Dichomitus squalens (strain LYAD-421) TaxID=732165 RepID=R7SP32_DICSQ|nr:uncharacterized protein DICSQDRAFT_70886 [Dichomitus squalens LYAD-421 SS1]EJF56722.1 hypothetical protein DICSQDRAFT_70886 [Dichomitus squalens LYAD-421 SS1]
MPFRLLSSALVHLLRQPDIEWELDAWRYKPPPPPGIFHSIQDSRRWKALQGADGEPFFGPQGGHELRIAVILHVNWFSASSSAFSASYSSGAISFSIPNLPPVLRYRVENLILSAMTDGPKEPDAEELQHWLELVVDDLLVLFYLGIFAPTESRKEGRRMRVALVCTCADHPAMCKAAGFADKSHLNAPCTQGITDANHMYSDECLNRGCLPRSAELHVAHARAWKSLEDKKDRDEYFKQHGSRWSELMRLPYYDCVAMTVIDPMHNLLLGKSGLISVVKNQWYSRWIKGGTLRADTKAGTKRELSVLHRFLDTFEAPEWVGRLPLRVGEPAGGSLTADEYKLMIICPGMLIVSCACRVRALV